MTRRSRTRAAPASHSQRASPTGFSDGAAHRASLHAVYNHYVRVGADPFYQSDTEDVQALLRPLFLTAWLIDDFLADNAFFGINAANPAGGSRGAVAPAEEPGSWSC